MIHDYAVLAFYTAGRLTLESHGRWNVREGDLLLLPAGRPHRTLESRKIELQKTAFSRSTLGDIEPSLLDSLERVRAGAAPIVAIPGERQTYLESLFRELDSSSEQPSVRRSLLTLILAEIARAGGVPSTRPGIVAEALRFIERNCLGPLSPRDVAAALGRSPAHLTTALTRATGLSAGQWIIAGRIAEAERLLLASDESVEAIAERVGYADVTHFIRMFRRARRRTPAAWRIEKHADRAEKRALRARSGPR